MIDLSLIYDDNSDDLEMVRIEKLRKSVVPPQRFDWEILATD